MSNSVANESIVITSNFFTPAEIAAELKPQLDATQFQVSITKGGGRPASLFLTPEVVSVVVAGINVLASSISALLIFMAKCKSGKIVIVGASGRKIEVPRDTPPEKVAEYVNLAKSLDPIDHIYIAR